MMNQVINEMVYDIQMAWKGEGPIALPTIKYGMISLEEAYTIQDALVRAIEVDTGRVVGYKVAFADKESQKKYGIAEPVTGRLFEKQQVEDGGRIPLKEYHLFHIEAEIALIVDRLINHPIKNVDDFFPYIRSMHVGFDIADNRFDRTTREQNIADFVAGGCGAHHFVIGSRFSLYPNQWQKAVLEIIHNGEKIYEGSVVTSAGNPLETASWMVNSIVKRGFCLDPGHVLLTGKVAPPFKATGDLAKGSYLGRCGSAGLVACEVV